MNNYTIYCHLWKKRAVKKYEPLLNASIIQRKNAQLNLKSLKLEFCRCCFKLNFLQILSCQLVKWRSRRHPWFSHIGFIWKSCIQEIDISCKLTIFVINKKLNCNEFLKCNMGRYISNDILYKDQSISELERSRV